MKLNFIISLLLYVLTISKIEYDLVDGIEKTINNVNYNLEYSFYIKASKPNVVRFTLSVPLSSPYFSLVHIDYNEYSERSSISPNKNSWDLLSRIEINNKALIYFSYNIYSSMTNYVEFKVKAPNTYNYMNARIDLSYKEYDLGYNKPLNIYNLASNNAYYLYFELFENTIANINLKINNMVKKPFSGIYIHELKTRKNSPSIDITDQPISFISNYSQLTSSFSYSVKFPNITKYIALKIKSSLDIDQISVIYENPLTIIDLNQGIWKEVNNLKSEEKYLFFIEATQCAKASISFIVNNTHNNSFN